MRTKTECREFLTIVVGVDQLELLKKQDFPGSQDVIGSARRSSGHFRLRGTRVDMERLAGWVAGEANHARDRETAEPFNDLADEIEGVLACS